MAKAASMSPVAAEASSPPPDDEEARAALLEIEKNRIKLQMEQEAARQVEAARLELAKKQEAEKQRIEEEKQMAESKLRSLDDQIRSLTEESGAKDSELASIQADITNKLGSERDKILQRKLAARKARKDFKQESDGADKLAEILAEHEPDQAERENLLKIQQDYEDANLALQARQAVEEATLNALAELKVDFRSEAMLAAKSDEIAALKASLAKAQGNSKAVFASELKKAEEEIQSVRDAAAAAVAGETDLELKAKRLEITSEQLEARRARDKAMAEAEERMNLQRAKDAFDEEAAFFVEQMRKVAPNKVALSLKPIVNMVLGPRQKEEYQRLLNRQLAAKKQFMLDALDMDQMDTVAERMEAELVPAFAVELAELQHRHKEETRQMVHKVSPDETFSDPQWSYLNESSQADEQEEYNRRRKLAREQAEAKMASEIEEETKKMEAEKAAILAKKQEEIG